MSQYHRERCPSFTPAWLGPFYPLADLDIAEYIFTVTASTASFLHFKKLGFIHRETDIFHRSDNKENELEVYSLRASTTFLFPDVVDPVNLISCSEGR